MKEDLKIIFLNLISAGIFELIKNFVNLYFGGLSWKTKL